jgi:hypothetical protein
MRRSTTVGMIPLNQIFGTAQTPLPVADDKSRRKFDASRIGIMVRPTAVTRACCANFSQLVIRWS